MRTDGNEFSMNHDWVSGSAIRRGSSPITKYRPCAFYPSTNLDNHCGTYGSDAGQQEVANGLLIGGQHSGDVSDPNGPVS